MSSEERVKSGAGASVFDGGIRGLSKTLQIAKAVEAACEHPAESVRCSDFFIIKYRI